MTRLEGAQLTLGAQLLYADLGFSIGPATSPALGSSDGGNPVGWFPGGGIFYSYSVSPDLKLGFAGTGNFGLAQKYDDDWVGRYYVQDAHAHGRVVPAVDRLSRERQAVAGREPQRDVRRAEGRRSPSTTSSAPTDSCKIDRQVGLGRQPGRPLRSRTRARASASPTTRRSSSISPRRPNSPASPRAEALLAVARPARRELDLDHGAAARDRELLPRSSTIAGRCSAASAGSSGRGSARSRSASTRTTPTSLTTDLNFKDTWHAALGAQYRMASPRGCSTSASPTTPRSRRSNVSPVLPANAAWRFGVGAQKAESKTSTGACAPSTSTAARSTSTTQPAPVAARRPRQSGGHVQQHRHPVPGRQFQLEVLTRRRPGARVNLEKVIFGFFIIFACTLNFGFFIGDLERPELHHPMELFAAVVVNLIATVLKFGDRTQLGATHLATSLVASFQLIAASMVWVWQLYVDRGPARTARSLGDRLAVRRRAARQSVLGDPADRRDAAPGSLARARAGPRMGDVLFLILRRLRAPLITLILVYAISVGGLALIPGVDADGNPRADEHLPRVLRDELHRDDHRLRRDSASVHRRAAAVGHLRHLPVGDRLGVRAGLGDRARQRRDVSRDAARAGPVHLAGARDRRAVLHPLRLRTERVPPRARARPARQPPRHRRAAPSAWPASRSRTTRPRRSRWPPTRASPTCSRTAASAAPIATA